MNNENRNKREIGKNKRHGPRLGSRPTKTDTNDSPNPILNKKEMIFETGNLGVTILRRMIENSNQGVCVCDARKMAETKSNDERFVSMETRRRRFGVGFPSFQKPSLSITITDFCFNLQMSPARRPINIYQHIIEICFFVFILFPNTFPQSATTKRATRKVLPFRGVTMEELQAKTKMIGVLFFSFFKIELG